MRKKVETLVAGPQPLFRRRLPQPLSTIFLTICEAQVTPLRSNTAESGRLLSTMEVNSGSRYPACLSQDVYGHVDLEAQHQMLSSEGSRLFSGKGTIEEWRREDNSQGDGTLIFSNAVLTTESDDTTKYRFGTFICWQCNPYVWSLRTNFLYS